MFQSLLSKSSDKEVRVYFHPPNNGKMEAPESPVVSCAKPKITSSNNQRLLVSTFPDVLQALSSKTNKGTSDGLILLRSPQAKSS